MTKIRVMMTADGSEEPTKNIATKTYEAISKQQHQIN
jgi:hypothetical protein